MPTTVVPNTIRTRAPAFAGEDDTTLQAAIDEAVRWINEPAWGASHFDDGVLYLACHILTEDALLKAAPDAASQGEAIPAGPLASEKILTWSASYAVSEGGVFADALATTAWGRRFLARRQLVFPSRCL